MKHKSIQNKFLGFINLGLGIALISLSPIGINRFTLTGTSLLIIGSLLLAIEFTTNNE